MDLLELKRIAVELQNLGKALERPAMGEQPLVTRSQAVEWCERLAARVRHLTDQVEEEMR